MSTAQPIEGDDEEARELIRYHVGAAVYQAAEEGSRYEKEPLRFMQLLRLCAHILEWHTSDEPITDRYRTAGAIWHAEIRAFGSDALKGPAWIDDELAALRRALLRAPR